MRPSQIKSGAWYINKEELRYTVDISPPRSCGCGPIASFQVTWIWPSGENGYATLRTFSKWASCEATELDRDRMLALAGETEASVVAKAAAFLALIFGPALTEGREDFE